jgi:hypothetical protein
MLLSRRVIVLALSVLLCLRWSGDGKKQREDGLAWLAGASNHIVCKLQTFQGNVLSCLGIISVFFFI